MTDNNWKLVDAFFDKYDLVDHHIKSYNDFVNNRIQKIIDISEPIVIENDETDDETILEARERFASLKDRFDKEIEPEAAEVREAGGLFIIGTERHVTVIFILQMLDLEI